MRSKLSFQNLNTFAAAAERLSFQDAAETLHVSASAVSHQIRSLEAMLGYPLFERLDKRVRLTNRGKQLFLEIRDPLRQLHQASRNALRGSDDSTLSLSVLPVFATRWLLPRLKDFRIQYPEVSLSVVASADLVDFRSDPFDAAIRMGSGHWPDLVAKRLFGQRIAAVGHPKLVTSHGSRFTVEELPAQTLINNSSVSGLWQEWFESAGSTPKGALTNIEVQGMSQVLEAINAEEGIGLIDLSFVETDLEEERLMLACDHVLTGDGGYFLTYPESMSERTSLQVFQTWALSQIER